MNTHRNAIWKAAAVFIAAVLVGASFAQTITLTKGPSKFRLYQRDAANIAKVAVAGSVSGGGAVTLQVYEDTRLINTQNGQSPFSFTQEIQAKLANYRFVINGKTIADSVVCGDAFMINGQSNAEAFQPRASNPWVRTLGTSPSVATLSRDSTWAIALSTAYTGEENKTYRIGCWGMRLGELLVQNSKKPVAFFMGATGGVTLGQHMRNNSNPLDSNTIYGRMLWRMRKAGLDQSVKALLWHQGENSGYDALNGLNYYKDYMTLVSQWNQDYPAMKTIYMFQIRRGCSGNWDAHVREAQRQLGFKNRFIHLMSTVGLSNFEGCHYAAAGYVQMAEWVCPLVARYNYNFYNDSSISPPNLLQASYGNVQKTSVALQFDQDVTWASGVSPLIKVGGQTGKITSGSANRNTITLQLSAAPANDSITYCDSDMDGGWSTPWIFGINGRAALTFRAAHIDAQPRTFIRGCTDNAYVEYDSNAAVQDFSACKTLKSTVAVQQNPDGPNTIQPYPGRASSVNITINGSRLEIVPPAAGACHFNLVDMHGKSLVNTTVSGRTMFSLSGFSHGVFIAKVEGKNYRALKKLAAF